MLSKAQALGFRGEKNCRLLFEHDDSSQPFIFSQINASSLDKIPEIRFCKRQIRIHYRYWGNTAGIERVQPKSSASERNEGLCFLKISDSKLEETDEGWRVHADF